MTREELQSLLDAHGTDSARWPSEVRAAAMRLIARDAEATRMFREAQALDRLLDADAPPPASLMAEDMTRAIIARAGRAAGDGDVEETDRAASAAVIPFPSGQRGAGFVEGGGREADRKGTRLPPAANDDRPLRWMAAGVLAASLVLGIALGGALSRTPVSEQLLEPVRMALADEGLGEIVTLASPASGGELP